MIEEYTDKNNLKLKIGESNLDAQEENNQESGYEHRAFDAMIDAA